MSTLGRLAASLAVCILMLCAAPAAVGADASTAAKGTGPSASSGAPAPRAGGEGAASAMSTSATASGAGAVAPSSCVACHGRLDGPTGAPVKAFANDVHAAAGLGCESCHGGDPSPALAEDGDAAMNPRKGFTKAPDRLHVAQFCARCHADASFMKRFNPQARVDQYAEYQTSVHGKLNAKGDPVPAVCTDCHGDHGILAVSSPDAPVYATNVPKTCARCHSSAETMKPYGIPTTQYDEYRRSVHAAALLDRGDISAPACNDCHGNHGATPPGVQSVAYVCGQCHGRESTLFQASFKKKLFDTMQAGECTVCHDHHRISHPTPDLFHGASEPEVSSGKVTSMTPFAADLGPLAAGAKATASWRTVLRPSIPPDDERLVHKVRLFAQGAPALQLDLTLKPGGPAEPPPVREASSGALTVRATMVPESGLPVESGDAIHYRLEIENTSGSPVEGLQIRDLPGAGIDSIAGSACLKCHSPGDKCDQATEKMYAAVTGLDEDLRSAGAVLHQAEVAGMEVSGAKFDLKRKGTTAAVESRALIHTFDPAKLIQRTEEGRSVAKSALAAGRAALAEVQFRRKGLAVSLLLIGMVLAALFLKIRQVDRMKRAPVTR